MTLVYFNALSACLMILMVLISVSPVNSFAQADDNDETDDGRKRCADITLVRAEFTNAITDREPDQSVSLINDQTDQVFAFTEIENAGGETLIHRWFYKGKEAAEVKLYIGGERWRTWSRKRMGLRRTGDWHVEFMTETGCPVGSLNLNGFSNRLDGLIQTSTLDSLMAPILSALETDLTTAKIALAEQQQQHPDKADLLQTHAQPYFILAAAEKGINDGELYIAQSRLESFSARTAAQQDQYQLLVATLEDLKISLDKDVATTVRAISSQASNEPLPCNITVEQLKQYLTSNLPEVSVIKSELGEDNWQVALLDSRTGTPHGLDLRCVGLSE